MGASLVMRYMPLKAWAVGSLKLEPPPSLGRIDRPHRILRVPVSCSLSKIAPMSIFRRYLYPHNPDHIRIYDDDHYDFTIIGFQKGSCLLNEYQPCHSLDI